MRPQGNDCTLRLQGKIFMIQVFFDLTHQGRPFNLRYLDYKRISII